MNKKGKKSEEANDTVIENKTAGQEANPKDSNPKDKEPEKKQEKSAAADKSAELLKETETLKTELSEQKDKYLRLAAEYDNYRKRTAKEKENAYTFAVADTAEKLIGCVDNLERAMTSGGNDFDSFKDGVAMVLKQMKDKFKEIGVVEIDPAGQQFDPQYHNAVMRVEPESPQQENTVIEVLQKGYMIGEKVIRHAMVKVANS